MPDLLKSSSAGSSSPRLANSCNREPAPTQIGLDFFPDNGVVALLVIERLIPRNLGNRTHVFPESVETAEASRISLFRRLS